MLFREVDVGKAEVEFRNGRSNLFHSLARSLDYGFEPNPNLDSGWYLDTSTSRAVRPPHSSE